MPSTEYIWEHHYNGEHIGNIVRILRDEVSPKTGKRKKDDFPFYVPAGNGKFEKGIPTALNPRPLFGLSSYIDPKEPVFIVEGQKKQFALSGLGFQVVTNIGGSNAYYLSNWADIRNAVCVYFLPDNDVPGEKFAKNVWRILREQNSDREFSLIKLPGLPSAGDVCDWLKSQPELADWNELDPLHNLDEETSHKIRERLKALVKISASEIPPYWAHDVQWQHPEDLMNRYRPVRKLIPELLPPIIRARAQDIAHRMQCPLEYTAISLITMLSTVIGAGCGIRPKKHDDWTVIPNLWGFVVGEPGRLKTPAMKECMAPLEALQAAALKDFKEQQKQYDIEKDVYDSQMSAMKDTLKKINQGGSNKFSAAVNPIEAAKHEISLLEEPAKPARRRLLTHDATIEKIVELCAENPRGLMVFVDEVAQLFEAMSQENRSSDRPFFLTAWNGNSSAIHDRIARGTIEAENVCISILGSIQPDTLRHYLNAEATGQASNDGFFQRFQLGIFPDDPESESELIDEAPDVHAKWKVGYIAEKLFTADFSTLGAIKENGNKQPYFRFDDAAQSYFYDFWRKLQLEIKREEDPIVKNHLAKYGSLMPSLALIFHLVNLVDTECSGMVDLDSAQLAGAWCAFLKDHARRIYKIGITRQSAPVLALAQHIQTGRLGTKFTARNVKQRGWHMLGDQQVIDDALKELTQMNWLALQEMRPGPGRPTKTYLVNPTVYTDENDVG